VNRLRGFKWAPVLHLSKDEEKCTKCGICKRVCPLQVTEVYEQKGGNITTSMCMLCLRCVEMCPYESCLKVKMAGKTLFESRNWLEPSENE
jgi:formate hydrogenlyase subunit 6/NADH:ubiquinone oxidoreductase subunit I